MLKERDREMTYILALISAVIVVLADQLTKIAVASNLTLGCTPEPLIPYLFNLTYIHNRGGAWGILSSHRAVLLILTCAVMAACVFILVKYCRKKPLLFWALSLVLAGGVGNMYDRIFRDGNVIDFLQFAFWTDFPVFNVADISVVVGCGLMILSFVLDFIKESKEKQNENLDH